VDIRAPGDADLLGLLVRLWQVTLDDPGLGPDDNFFLVGGHSVLALRMLADLRERTGADLSLTDLLDAPTPLELVDAHGQAMAGRNR
jgi:aryl carrier-like protein